MSNNLSKPNADEDIIRFVGWIGRISGWYVAIHFFRNLNIDQATKDQIGFNIGWFIGGIMSDPPIGLVIVFLFVLVYGAFLTVIWICGEIGRNIFMYLASSIQKHLK